MLDIIVIDFSFCICVFYIFNQSRGMRTETTRLEGKMAEIGSQRQMFPIFTSVVKTSKKPFKE